jgi:hypothetical protein
VADPALLRAEALWVEGAVTKSGLIRSDLSLTLERAVIEAGVIRRDETGNIHAYQQAPAPAVNSADSVLGSYEAVYALSDRFGRRVARRLRQEPAILADQQHRAGHAAPATAAAGRGAALISYIVIPAKAGDQGERTFSGALGLGCAGATKAN